MVDRRGLVVAAGALLVSGCGKTAAGGTATTATTDLGTQAEADIELLNGLLDLEQRSVSAYEELAAHRPLIATLLGHEREHVKRLTEAVRHRTGTPVAPVDSTPQGDPLEYAAKVENTAIAAYLDAIPKLQDPALRRLAAAIVATEAEHLAVLDGARGIEQATQPFVTGEREL